MPLNCMSKKVKTKMRPKWPFTENISADIIMARILMQSEMRGSNSSLVRTIRWQEYGGKG